MDKKEYLTLERAEKIVDNMYQSRWEECGVDDGNTIHMGNLENLHYSELERASILLLRTEIRLKRENQELKKQLEAKNIQQKEFIDLLEGMYFETDDNWWFAILNKYKEIIGSDK